MGACWTPADAKDGEAPEKQVLRYPSTVTDDAIDTAALVAEYFGDGVRLELSSTLGRSLRLSNSLREVHRLALDADRDGAVGSAGDVADATESGRKLAEADRLRLREVYHTTSRVLSAGIAARSADESAEVPWASADVMGNLFPALALLADIQAGGGAGVSAIGASPWRSGDEGLYLAAYADAVDRAARTGLLLQALVVTALDSLKPLVSRMVELLVHSGVSNSHVPSAAANADKTAGPGFSAPGEWREVLVGAFDIPALQIAVDWDLLEDIWDGQGSGSGEAGTIFEVVGATTYAITVAVWDRIVPGTGAKLFDATYGLILESLRAGRWRQAEGLARVQEAFAADGELLASARINRWLALDRGLGVEAVREEVESWDTTSLHTTFQLARLILLRQDGEALELLHDLIDRGVIKTDHVADWPLFDRLREAGRLDGLMPDLVSGM